MFKGVEERIANENRKRDQATLEFQATVNKMQTLVKEGKINLFTKYQMTSVKGNGQLESIDIKNDEDEKKNIKADYVLGFFVELFFV